MESLGEKIRKHREEKGYSLEQVARDTHITKRFLEAIEMENFAILPGESYVVGFLRSYSEYLGLNPEESVSLYRNMRLQEQQAPMEELLVKQGPSAFAKILVSVLVALALGAGAFLIYLTGLPPAEEGDAVAQVAPIPEASAEMVVFDGKVMERTFLAGAPLRFPLGNTVVDTSLAYKGDKVQILINGEAVILDINTDAVLDIDQNGNPDVRILVRSVDSRTNPARIVARIDREVSAPASAAETPADPAAAALEAPVPGLAESAVSLVPALGNLPSPLGQSSLQSRQKAPVILQEATAVGPIAVKLVFSRATLFRVQTEDRKVVERFSTAGETVNLTAIAWLRMWVADGGSARLMAGGKEYVLGLNGEATAWQASWTDSAAGGKILQLQAMY